MPKVLPKADLNTEIVGPYISHIEFKCLVINPSLVDL
jgi:hypothetical protein